MNRVIKYIYLFITLYIFIVSCESSDDLSVEEIEPNDNAMYAQFVGKSMFIKADISTDDIDYYHIKLDKALYFSFDIKTSLYKNPLVFEIIENDKVISQIDTGKIKNYDGNINYPVYKIDNTKNYYFKISNAGKTDNKMYYHLTVNFYSNFITEKEIEPNNTFSLAQHLMSPNTKIEGFFIKSVIDDFMRSYVGTDDIIDIDTYKIENVLNKNISMDIIFDYSDKSKAKMILFDENYNYLLQDNNINYLFPSGSVFYVMIFLEQTDFYTLPYNLEYKTY